MAPCLGLSNLIGQIIKIDVYMGVAAEKLVRVCGPQHALNSGIPDYMFIMLGPKNKIKINTNIKIKIKIKLTIIIRSTSDSKSNSK